MSHHQSFARILAHQDRFTLQSRQDGCLVGGVGLNNSRSSANNYNPVLEFMLKSEDGLMENAKWCWAKHEVPLLDASNGTVEELAFYRDFVSKNTPCVLEGMIHDDQAKRGALTEAASIEALTRVIGKKMVRVNCTPNGRADSIVWDEASKRKVFAMPEEREMEFAVFAKWLTTPPSVLSSNAVVHYISAQNDSLREEYAELFAQPSFTPTEVQRFATKLFGREPDAVNLWVGDERSTSVMHHDTYENMYCCLHGTKVFHLLPPCALPFMNECAFPNAQWRGNELESVAGETPWIERDIVDEDARWLPRAVRDLIQRVELRAGQCLYLPSGWLHRVTQVGPTVAVNFWYDRDLDPAWAMMDCLHGMAKTFPSRV